MQKNKLFEIKHCQVNINTICVNGALTFDTISTVWHYTLHSWNDMHRKVLTIDFSEVSLVDSAAVAFLIECKKQALQHRQTIVFKHIPTALVNIAKLSGVDSWLEIN
jgi:ABC-type transporter Mla MlaB component